MRKSDEEAEWYAATYEGIVDDKNVRQHALMHAESMRQEDDPEISPSDLQASRGYIRTCIENMSQTEVLNKSVDDLGALWARGVLGAARYRNNPAAARGRPRSGRRKE